MVANMMMLDGMGEIGGLKASMRGRKWRMRISARAALVRYFCKLDSLPKLNHTLNRLSYGSQRPIWYGAVPWENACSASLPCCPLFFMRKHIEEPLWNSQGPMIRTF